MADEGDSELFDEPGEIASRQLTGVDLGGGRRVGRNLPALGHDPFGEITAKEGLEVPASPQVLLEAGAERDGSSRQLHTVRSIATVDAPRDRW